MTVIELFEALKDVHFDTEIILNYSTFYTNDSGTTFDQDEWAELRTIGLSNKTGKLILSSDYMPVDESEKVCKVILKGFK